MYVTVLLLPKSERSGVYMYSHVTTQMSEASIHSRPPNNNAQQLRVPVSNNTTLIHAPIRINIVITESITPPINLLPMNKGAEPINRSTTTTIIPIRMHPRLEVPSINQQRPAIKSSAQTRHNSAMDPVVGASDSKGPAVAAENICGGGFGVSSIVSRADEGVVGDPAGDVAGAGLRVDRERVGCVVVPDIVDVLGEVGLESGRVQGDVVYRRDDAERFPRGARLAEVAPGHSVAGCLGDEDGADGGHGGRLQASGGLDGAVAGLHGEAEDEADEVDVGDVGVQAAGGVVG